MYSDLTVIICSYKATKIFTLCLHQLGLMGIKNSNLLIYENSPEDYTLNRELLDYHHINYIDNPGGQHADTMNRALKECKTKYALLLDSDCICTNYINENLNYVKRHNIQLYGEIAGDRGGLHIHKRVHPWFCIVDVEFIQQHNIDFVDFKRIEESHSESFVQRNMLGLKRDQQGFYYDAGSSMFEDVIANDGIVVEIGDKKPYFHLEGCSWRNDFKVYEKVVEIQDKHINNLFEKLKYNPDVLNKISE